MHIHIHMDGLGKEEEGGKRRSDFYTVLGLGKECNATDIRIAYKKLALRWHPDRCSKSAEEEEEAKKNFQAIQQAYSVLSDASKRFLYDIGAYNSDDDDNNEMGDFLSEMTVMMSQTQPNENREESFEELQKLFNEIFQEDVNAFQSTGSVTSSSCYYPSMYTTTYGENSSSSNTRSSSELNFTGSEASLFSDACYQNFCLGVDFTKEKWGRGGGARRRYGSGRRHHKIVSSKDGISAGGRSIS